MINRVEFDDTDVRNDYGDTRLGKYAINDMTAFFLMVAFDECAGIKKICLHKRSSLPTMITSDRFPAMGRRVART